MSTKSGLKTHQTKTKSCIEKQKVLDIDLVIQTIECEYCNKTFTHKHRLDTHLLSCNEKKQKEFDTMVKKYEEEILNMRSEINILKEELFNCKLEVATEKEKGRIYSDIINKNQSEKQSKTTANTKINKKFNDMTPLDLSTERLKSIMNTYTMKHYEKGVVGQVSWLVDNFLTDKDKNLTYRCCDKSRKNFIYNNGKEYKRDLDADILISIVSPILKEKLKEYKKIKCMDMGDETDDDNSSSKKITSINKENFEFGDKFIGQLSKKCYQS